MDVDDPELALALQLREEAEREAARRSGKSEEAVQNKLHTIKFNAGPFGQNLQPGFKALYESKDYTDITLIVGGEKIPAHKIVLCSWSDTFKVMLQNENWKESHQQELPVQIEEKEVPLFKKMLAYMYTGSIEVTLDEVLPLLALSNYYSLLPLKDACGEILGKNIDDDNVFTLLEIVQQYSCSKLNQQCAEYLAENFGELLVKDKLMNLDVETWYEMLRSDDIQVNSEEDVVDAILRYAQQFEPKKRIETLTRLLPTVRFPVLGADYLIQKIETNPQLQEVPNLTALLHETYKYKAYPDAPVKLIQTKPRKGTVLWDTSNADFNISSDRLTATNTHRQNIWSTVRCVPQLPEGISYRELKVKFTSYIMVGIETTDNASSRSYNQYPGQTPNGWSWYSAGQTYHSNVCTQSQSPFASGDTVGILVDTHRGKNQQPVNASFSNLPKNKEFNIVISTYSQGDSATIIPGRNIPLKLPSGWSSGDTEESKTAKSKRGGRNKNNK